MRRVLIALAVIGVGAVAAPAGAHGDLVDARPGPGASVGGEVVEVELVFPESVTLEGSTVTVSDEAGTVLGSDDLSRPTETLVRAAITPITDAGTYRVDYAVLSDDGFLFAGSYLFSHDPAQPPVEPLPFGRVENRWLWLVLVGGFVLFLVGGGWIAMRRGAPED